MRKITSAQRELLGAVAAADIYKIKKGGEPGVTRVGALLQKRGLLTVADTGDECLLTITDAGRALLSADGIEPTAPVVPAVEEVPPMQVEEQALPRGKLGIVVVLLRRKEGARMTELQERTGWQAHSVRGAMSGALKKRLGLSITSEMTDGGRIYRIANGEEA